MDMTITKESGTPAIADDQRWSAVERRDKAADGSFILAVKTTGIYCRPSCPARQAKRVNVVFFADAAAAERAGFRPCKRCRPTEQSLATRQAQVIAEACRSIERAIADGEPEPLLRRARQASRPAGLSFPRVFKASTGVTPKAYAAARRAARARRASKAASALPTRSTTPASTRAAGSTRRRGACSA